MKTLSQLLRHRMRRLQRWLLRVCLPKLLRYQLYRDLIVLPEAPPEGIRFKIAQTKEELSQAFKLLHDLYVESGYMDPHPSGMRITKYHALPSTTTLIALKGEKVVATVSLVRGGAFGLPCETLFNISFLKRKFERTAEATALAVDREFHGQKGSLLWPLLKFQSDYLARYFGVENVAITVVPEWFEFYASLLFFKPFTNKKMKYAYTKGIDVIGGYIRLTHNKVLMEEAYSHKPRQQNLFRFAFEKNFAAFEFPKREYSVISDPVMTPELLDYFFNQQSDVFAQLSIGERKVLHSLYTDGNYQKVLPELPRRDFELHSHKNRFELKCQGRILVPGGSAVDIEVRNASLNGLGGVLHRELRAGEFYHLELELGRGKLLELSITPTWNNEDGTTGFAIQEPSIKWQNFISELERQTHCMAA